MFFFIVTSIKVSQDPRDKTVKQSQLNALIQQLDHGRGTVSHDTAAAHPLL